MSGVLHRSLGLPGSVAIGLSAMIGAGVFVVFAPATAAAGDHLFLALALAAFVALCNAISSARLAALHPESGGTYVYGRERLGARWGHLAGWAFVVGKIASCAAMSLAIGYYAWPQHAHLIAVFAVASVTMLNYTGIQKSTLAAYLVVSITLAVLAAVVLTALASPAQPSTDAVSGSGRGVLEAAGLLFFAFAGYARLATLGEEVRDPRHTIPRAIALSLVITVAVYALVAIALLRVLGQSGLAATAAPLTRAAQVVDFPGLETAVRVGAVVAASGALLSLVLGISRTVLAMARDGYFPRQLAAVHPRFAVPHRAEVAVGILIAALAVSVDLRHAIGFSSFLVLAYYFIANASAWTLSATARSRVVPLFGMAGCLVLGFSLPAGALIAGAAVLVTGFLLWFPTHDKERTP